jgi:hypothetical protein
MVLRSLFGSANVSDSAGGKINLVIVVVLLIGIALSSCSIVDSDPFVMVGGDEELLVLMRNDEDGYYQVRYEGRQPAELHSLHVMLGGQILHVDVVQVTIIQGENEVVLNGDATLPDGSQVVLEPGEEFEVRVTFHGQSLGGNYMYGFRIVYGDDPQADPIDLTAEYDFAVIVE